MKKTTITGLEEKWEVLLVYIFSILGFVFAFMNYDYLSDNIRFHYKQSGALWIINIIISILKIILNNIFGFFYVNLLLGVLSTIIFVLIIVTIVKAFNNETYEIPVVSDFAKSIWK